jgi:hypothetical protein
VITAISLKKKNRDLAQHKTTTTTNKRQDSEKGRITDMQKIIALQWTVPAIVAVAIITLAIVAVAVFAGAGAGTAFSPPAP